MADKLIGGLFAEARNAARRGYAASASYVGRLMRLRSASYRRFDSHLVPQDAVPVITAGLKLPATADEWRTGRAGELDRRLKRFSRRLLRGELEDAGFDPNARGLRHVLEHIGEHPARQISELLPWNYDAGLQTGKTGSCRLKFRGCSSESRGAHRPEQERHGGQA